MTQIPFTVYARIIPDQLHNQRRTHTRSLEKISGYVAADINQYIEDNSSSFAINAAAGVSVSPQFGQYSAKVTITGWDAQD